jgi:hypothetical protein
MPPSKSVSALKHLIGEHVMIILRGPARIPSVMKEGLVHTNTFIGWVKHFDKEFIYMGENPGDDLWQTLIKRSDVSVISISPSDEELMMGTLHPEKDEDVN